MKNIQEYKYIGECTGNNGNGCFIDSPGHNCGCFTRVPKEEPKQELERGITITHVGKPKQEQTFKQKLVIELNEYDYTGSSNDIYGMVVKVNGVEMPYHNLDTSTILEEVLEHLGYEVEIIETLDR